MRRLVAIVVISVLALTFVGSPATRAATVTSNWPSGPKPFSLALDSATGKVYVANSGTATNTTVVTVIDPTSNVTSQLATSGSPSNFVLVDSSRRRLYSSNAIFTDALYGPSVDAFDLNTNSRIGSLPVGGLQMALDPVAGRLYVVDGYHLTVIDTATFTVTATLAVPFAVQWFGVAADPQRGRLYLTNSGQRPSVFVLNSADLSTVAEIPFATVPRYAIAVDPVRHFVFVAGSDPLGGPFAASAFSVIDADSLTIVHTTSTPGFPMGIALAADSHRIFMTDGARLSNPTGRRIFVIDDGTFDVVDLIERLDFDPGLPLVHPDGRLYVPNYNPDYAIWAVSAIDPANHAPVFQSLTLMPGTVFTGDTIRADAMALDPDIRPVMAADPTTYGYQWSRNGTPIAGATASTLDLAVPGNGDRGDTISVRVTASDGQLSNDASTSVVVSDSPPTASVSLNNTAPTTNAVLDAAVTATDPDNDPLTYRFIWRVSGALRRSSSGLNASDSLDLGVPGNGDHGDNVVVELVASDGTLDSPVATAGATVVNSAPTVAISLNTTSPTTKSVLVATVVGEDIDNDGLTYVYTWCLDGVVKRTVTTPSTTDRYDLSVRGNGDKGDVVTVTATATDGSLTSPIATISATIRKR